MEFSDGKVRGDDFDITDAQNVVNWGRYRQTNTLTYGPEVLTPNAVNPPSNNTINITPNISNTFQSLFVDGSVCAVSNTQVVPDWADTSSGVTMTIGYYTTNANAGDVNFDVRYTPVTIGATIFDGTNPEYVASIVSTVPGVTELAYLAQYTFDISAFAPSNVFVISIERDATAGNPLDTYTGDVVVYGMILTWTRKRAT